MSRAARKARLPHFFDLFQYEQKLPYQGPFGLMVFYDCTFFEPFHNTTQRKGFSVIICASQKWMIVLPYKFTHDIYIPINAKSCPKSKNKLYITDKDADISHITNAAKLPDGDHMEQYHNLRKTHVSVMEILNYKCKTKADVIKRFKPYAVAIKSLNMQMLDA